MITTPLSTSKLTQTMTKVEMSSPRQTQTITSVVIFTGLQKQNCNDIDSENKHITHSLMDYKPIWSSINMKIMCTISYKTSKYKPLNTSVIDIVDVSSDIISIYDHLEDFRQEGPAHQGSTHHQTSVSS